MLKEFLLLNIFVETVIHCYSKVWGKIKKNKIKNKTFLSKDALHSSKLIVNKFIKLQNISVK